MYSQATTQESQSQNTMYGSRKRARSNSGLARATSFYRGSGRRVPRPLRKIGAICPVTVNHDVALTTDAPLAFAFDTTSYYYNGTASAVNGASDLAAVYDNIRVMKVEFTILPAATSLDYDRQTLATGDTNIPWVYSAVDYNDASTPTLAQVQQLGTCQTSLLNKPIRRTLYPRIEGANGVVDMSTNYKNLFQKSGTASSQRWNGMKFYIDMRNQVWTYGSARIVMKIFYECKSSK